MALVLVAASYDNQSALTLTLQFDRDIDVSGINPAAIRINDGELEQLNVCNGVNDVGADWVTLGWEFLEPSGPGAITLNATAMNGIVAAQNPPYGAWAGVTDAVLPFP